MRLFVVRHGQTVWNSENRVCGITDSPLTNKGITQAKELSQSIKDRPIDVILSSPLSRALQTAEIIACSIEKEIIIDDRLTEQNYGCYEGVDRDNVDFKEAKKHFPFRLAGGESLLQLGQRVYNLLDEIKKTYSNQNVLVVTHGGVSRVINAYFTDQNNEDFYRFHIENCAIKEYNY
ncbi:putative phosphoglycerate mutase [Paenibacillus cellulosilyticus]|uniref:Putative phosphoglycerate mutase n=1 Tax=Paenibacillus cellulosilyticus TaxID=375489 RepID=A0A2V2YLH2_9BACL|nr:histidine phosphatase family protein [Paenibacillus cellulosilyticus]PWV94479.1 putative phosphoglycerate mutase [Paenibacillus cellulosilyticus]QKS44992.1 histidine phosphatase family protein [Paenibacillus cellulosilyticus]